MGLKALKLKNLVNVRVSDIKKDDWVMVISGKDKGKKSRVIEVNHRQGKARVEGVNVVKRHLKSNPTRGVKGGIIEKEGLIHISKLKVLRD